MASPKQVLQQERAELSNEYNTLTQESGELLKKARADNRSLEEAEQKRSDELDGRLGELDARLAGIAEGIEAYEKQERREKQAQALKDWRSEADTNVLDDVPSGGEPIGPYKAAGINSWGEALQAIAESAKSGVTDPRLMKAQATMEAAVSEKVPSDGGFLVETQRSDVILEKAYNTGQLLQRVQEQDIGAGFNSFKIHAVDETSRANGSRFGGIQSYWVDAGQTITDSKPKFAKRELKLKKLAAVVLADDEILADAVALESFINRVLPLELSFRAEDAIVNGTGAGMPQGYLTSGAKIAVPRNTTNKIEYVDVVNMYARMWGPSRSNGVWLTDQTADPQLFQMSLVVGTGGSAVFMPAGGASAAPFPTLFARPIIPMEYGAALGTEGDIQYVDLSQYIMIRKQLQRAQSMHVKFLEDQMAFRFTWRVDAQSLWDSPLTPKSAGDTLSPFVTLAA